MEKPVYERRLMKPIEVAKYLNISKSLVYQLIQSGDLPVIRIKSAVRIKPEDLFAYMEQTQSGSRLQLRLF